MTCTHPDCGQPKGECARDCLLFQTHRINTETMTKRCAAIKGNVEPIKFAPGTENTERRTVSPLRFAINTFRLYRRWKCSRTASLKHALLAFRSAR